MECVQDFFDIWSNLEKTQVRTGLQINQTQITEKQQLLYIHHKNSQDLKRLQKLEQIHKVHNLSMAVNSLLVCIGMSLFLSTYFVYCVKYSCTLKNCDALKSFTFPFNMKISPTKQVPTTFSISLRQKTHNPISQS